ncbi:MAG TPA: LLM class F420-dependent oxidoreductase [Acidimicrobiales bacterium]|nr:LLM class F420-dependent oxidoreductase [Acidimicrobiales bacterium]
MIRAGLQIPNFTYPGVAGAELFERVSAIARTAEESGFDTVMVMDHFYQLPQLGPPTNEMFEAYTLLGALAARTSRVNLGTLVTGVTYRNPAILAKEVTTLDVVSGGRAFLGIGAAWYEAEHQALGVDFPPVAERFERLEEALHITRAMFRGERPTFEGKHYRVRDAINSPAPVRPGGPPVMIGGSGERKTLRLAAQHADMLNLLAARQEVPHKLEVLAKHCSDVGRDMGTINKTVLGTLVLGRTMDEATDKRAQLLASRGVDWNTLDDATKAMLDGRFYVGDPDHVTEHIHGLLGMGLDGVTFNMPLDGHDLEQVAFAGEVITAALA